jgi:hypothetical protein
MAAIACAWLRKNVFQPCDGDPPRIVPVPVEIGAAGAIGWILCCQIFSANGLVAEQRLLMAKQRGPQNRELLVGL